MANRVKWGTLESEEVITNEIDAAYKIICSWKKNFFLLPFGKAGKDFVKELTSLMNLFVNKTRWERLAIPLVHIFVPIML